jgi:tetratricopeptide (TPR) repeat protein
MAQGDRLREREKPEAALDMYGEAHDLKPTRAEPLAGRGLALLDMGNHLAAAAAFEEALKYNPRYGPAIMGMAEALRLQGKNEQAIEYYQKYLDVLPNGVDATVARNNIERLKK